MVEGWPTSLARKGTSGPAPPLQRETERERKWRPLCCAFTPLLGRAFVSRLRPAQAVASFQAASGRYPGQVRTLSPLLHLYQ